MGGSLGQVAAVAALRLVPQSESRDRVWRRSAHRQPPVPRVRRTRRTPGWRRRS